MDIMAMTAQLAEGFLVTVQIFVLTLLFSLPLGMLVAFGRMSRCKIIKLIAKLYISVMRGTPLMLQIIVVYFAPYYMFRMKMGPGYRFPAVIIAFVINYAAYFAEIYRSGIDPCQMDSTRQHRCLVTTKRRLSFALFCRR